MPHSCCSIASANFKSIIMHEHLQNEIPAFLQEQVVYCVNIVLRNNLESTLLLTKQLQLYEFRSKQLINQLNLSFSCLAQEQQRLLHYKGAKTKWLLPQCEEAANDSSASVINFGKFIYNDANKYAYYLLLQCWQQLVVVQRLEDAQAAAGEFRLIKEWSQVKSFQLKHGSVQYQPVLQIHFSDGQSLETDLQATTAETASENPQLQPVNATAQHKKLQQLQMELKIQKEFTKRELQRYCDAQYFGNHLVRSAEMEEMQPLSRYSDVWLRINSADELIVGVPLVNNCTTPNLTIIKRIQAILMPDNQQQLQQYSFKCRLYQLKQRFENLESLETYFQADEQAQLAYGWLENRKWQMLPESFAVLVLVLNMQDLLLINDNCPLFISYEIEKNLQLLANKPPKIKIFKQQLFVKLLNLRKIFAQRQQLQITFQPTTLHQDFLAIASSHYELKLRLTFKSELNAEQFEVLLTQRFQCKVIKREDALNNSSLNMHLEEEQTNATELEQFPQLLLFNKDAQSMWYGLLAVREPSDTELQWLWKFYTNNKTRGLMLLRMLLDDFLREGINLAHIEHVTASMEQLHVDALAALHSALNLEMQHIIDMLQDSADMNEETHSRKLQDYIKLQLDTDLAMKAAENKFKDHAAAI